MLPSSIATLWLLFFIYSCIGWVVEEIYCSVPAGHFVNRGFLNGPYLPIYGSGAVAAVIMFRGLTSPLAIFLLGGAFCCALEFATSYVMEQIYHARWWDYSDKPLNLQGRCWAGGFVEFGVALCLVVLQINPPLLAWLGRFPAPTMKTAVTISFACMTTDLFITHKGLMELRAKMDALMKETRERALVTAAEARQRMEVLAVDARQRVDAVREQMGLPAVDPSLMLPQDPDEWARALDWHLGARLREGEEKARELRPSFPQLPGLDEVAARFRERLNGQERRVLANFPKLRPAHYRSLAQELAARIREYGQG